MILIDQGPSFVVKTLVLRIIGSGFAIFDHAFVTAVEPVAVAFVRRPAGRDRLWTPRRTLGAHARGIDQVGRMVPDVTPQIAVARRESLGVLAQEAADVRVVVAG